MLGLKMAIEIHKARAGKFFENLVTVRKWVISSKAQKGTGHVPS